MKCPYCAEEIKDEAMFCRYCGHDLSLFKLINPMRERISALEDQIAEIATSLEGLKSGNQYPVSTSSPRSKTAMPFRRAALAVLLSALLITVSIHVELPEDGVADVDSPLYPYGWLIAGLLASSPLLFGFWVGITWHGRHLKAYALLGAMSGIVGSIEPVVNEVVSILVGAAEHSYGGFVLVAGPPTRVSASLSSVSGILLLEVVVTVFISTMLFVSGGLFGDLLENWRRPNRMSESAVSRKIAEQVATSTSESFDKTIRILNVFYPATLGFIGILLNILARV